MGAKAFYSERAGKGKIGPLLQGDVFSRMPPALKTPAPHVQAALRQASPAPVRPASVQAARPAVTHGAPAPHVQAAVGRTAPSRLPTPPVQARLAPVPAPPAPHV